MPNYDYEPVDGKCDQCHGRFECFQKMAEKPLEKCPTCGKAVHRVYTTAGIGSTKHGGSYADAKKAGFTVLKKRDKGVYERL